MVSMNNSSRVSKKKTKSPNSSIPSIRQSLADLRLNSTRKKRRKEEDVSENRTADTTCEEEDNGKAVNMTPSMMGCVSNFKSDSLRPDTLNVMVKVELPREFWQFAHFSESVQLSRNMVFEKISVELMPFLIYGDQLFEVNGNQVNGKKNVETQFSNAANIPTPVILTVVRAWNIKPPTKVQLSTVTTIDEKSNAYFNVRVYRFCATNGCKLKFEKKKITVTSVSGKSNGNYAFIQGDKILDFDGSQEVQHLLQKYDITCFKRTFSRKMRKEGYIDCFIERQISVRSSPNPSVYCELTPAAAPAIKPTPDKIVLPIDPSIEPDAVEIALRELCIVNAVITDGFTPELKGRPLLKNAVPPRKTTTPAAAPKGKKKKTLRKVRRQQTIAFCEMPETSKILSDVGEDVELKKVDSRSGIVAYIKNAFGN